MESCKRVAAVGALLIAVMAAAAACSERTGPAALSLAQAEARRALVGPFAPDGGQAYTCPLPDGVPTGDTISADARSRLVLFEDGRELGPAHATHESIRMLGAGRYSHWGDQLYFSASDGSDPNANRRRYTFELRAPPVAATPGAGPDAGAAEAARIAAGIAAGTADHARRVQAALDFVHENSEHRIDAEHDRLAFDTPAVLRALARHAADPAAGRPPLSCGPRAYALQALLAELDITSRLVQVFSSRGPEPGAHRFLEVLDPRTGLWECWDPDQAVSYVDAVSRQRVSAEQFVLRGPQRVLPRRGDVLGWQALDLQWLGDHDFAAVLFEAFDRSAGMRDPVILFDPRRFSPEARFESGESFREWAQRMFGICRFVPVAEATASPP